MKKKKKKLIRRNKCKINIFHYSFENFKNGDYFIVSFVNFLLM